MAKKLKKENFISLFEKRIEKGIKFLDKKLGRKVWIKRIDNLPCFQIDSNTECVLAQVYRKKQTYGVIVDFVYPYPVGSGKLGLSREQLTDYGFCCTKLNGDNILKKLLSSMWYVKLYQLKNK